MDRISFSLCVLRNSRYTEVVSARQMQDAINGFETDKTSNWYRKNDEPRSKSGLENGLTLVFDGFRDCVRDGVLDGTS